MRVPGLEGSHAFLPLYETEGSYGANGTVLNQANFDTGNPTPIIPYKLTGIDGLRSSADISDARDPATGRKGEVRRRSARGGKTIVYRGHVRGRSVAELERWCSKLSRVFRRNVEMLCQLNAGSGGTAANVEYTCTVLSLEIAEELTKGPNTPLTYGNERAFTLTVRMLDPRFFKAATTYYTTAPVTGGEGGGILLPEEAPFKIGASSAVAGRVVVPYIEGDVETDPIIFIRGPVINPVIEDLTRGVSLRFKTSLDDNDLMVVDFLTRTIKNGDNEADMGATWDQANSDWWDPGVEGLPLYDVIVRLRGDTIGNPARAEIGVRPATGG